MKNSSEQLKEKWGDNLNPRCGIWIPDGWYNLVDNLLTELSEIDGWRLEFVSQIKEKFGGLRLYYNISDTNLSVENFQKIKKLIENAEDKSFQLCSVCGKEAELKNNNGWVSPFCVEHISSS